MDETAAADSQTGWFEASKSNAWTDMALTLPVFLGYHLGVVVLQVRNAADLVTAELVKLADHSIAIYWGLTLSVGVAFVLLLSILGQGAAFEKRRFAVICVEGVCYALLMRLAAGYVAGALPIGASGAFLPWHGVVMSLGAGLYEELIFRVGLFGVGALVIRLIFGVLFRVPLTIGWAFVAAALFAGWHYVGVMGDPWSWRTFVFRMACGLWLTGIYVFRGFAPAVWTHLLYDVWAIGFHS